MNAVKRLNGQYSQVKIGGKVRIWDGEDFLTQQDFIAMEAGRGEWTGKDNKKKFIADTTVWLVSKDRNLYRKTAFYPGKVSPDTFNLWTGWNVKPKQGNYSLFRSHLTSNVCNGHRKYSEWLWQWLAQLVQQPEIKPGTAVVLIGNKGCGKSIFADIIGELVGNNYITIANGESVTGRFNSMYEQCLLCAVDEAIWAGDKKGESVLKNIVTAKNITVERKGLECYSSPNFTRFIFTTNGHWAVPASMDERRFFVLKVNNDWTGNTDQFEAMLQQMENGGYAGLLYDLLHTKVDVNLRIPPKTEALDDQVKLSESQYVQFWRDFVENTDPEVWPEKIKKEKLSYLCMKSFKDRGVRQAFSNGQFFKELRKYIKPWIGILETDVADLSAGRKRYVVLPNHGTCMTMLGPTFNARSSKDQEKINARMAQD